MSAFTVDFATGGALLAFVVGVCGNANPGAQSKVATVTSLRTWRYGVIVEQL
jgi:hypothetical protein